MSRLRILFLLLLAPAGTFAACAQNGPTRDCGDKSTCENVCADLMTDKENCGQCGTVCSGAQACVGGKCAQSCPNGGVLCNNACVNSKFDNANCGMCGKT